MGDQSKGKGKRGEARPAEGGGTAAGTEDRVKALEAERDSLKAELAAARARIAELEDSRAQVASRIDSVISSLGALTEDKA